MNIGHCKMDLIKRKCLMEHLNRQLDFNQHQKMFTMLQLTPQLQLYVLGYKDLTGDNADF